MRFAKKIVIMCIIGCIILSTLFGVAWSASTLDFHRAGRQQVDIKVKHENGTLIDATDAMDVAIDTNVIVEFNQKINESTVEGNITLEFQANATMVPGKFSYETIDDNTTAIFTPNENLLKVTTYDFNINSWVRNETDWSIFPAGHTISFTTELFNNGTISGYILDKNNGTGIVGVNVTAYGNNNETLTYSDADGYYEFSLYPATYKIVADGTEVHYSVNETYKNVTEDVMLENVTLNLTEMAQQVKVNVKTRQTSGLPEPDNWIEADGATDVLIKPDIKIAFEEAMDFTSVKDNLTLYQNLVAVNGTLKSDDNITFYFDPTFDLNENTEYELTITSGVLPLNTSHEAPLWRDLNFGFTTRENPLKSVFPVDNAQDVLIDTEIEITFNIDIDESTLNKSITIDSISGDVAYTEVYDNVTRVATFTPDEVLDGDTVYTVHIADTLTDTDGTRVLPPDDFPDQ
ncbi:MAG: Ig-like domain-containing protein, partial [Thermoplasmata archaeon]|nr:Ig-like domain-containing protein [Thermoplasmata archaeon]